MSGSPDGIGHSRLENAIGLVLRWGVFTSAVIIAFGLAVFLITSNFGTGMLSLSSLPVTDGGVEIFRSRGDVFDRLLAGDPSAIMDFGLLVLIATPTVPVALSLLSYVRRRDLPFILITAWVFAVLVFGLVWTR